MKKYVIVLLIGITILLAGKNQNIGSDENIDVTAKVSSIDMSKVEQISKVDIEACFSQKYYNVLEIAEASENVVLGEIVGITYNDDNAIAKTFCSVEVKEVIKGEDVKENTVISIMELQGYCRLSKFIEVYGDAHFPDYDERMGDTTFFEYSVEGEPMVQIGEEYVFFLSPQLDKYSEDGERLDVIEGNYFITVLHLWEDIK